MSVENKAPEPQLPTASESMRATLRATHVVRGAAACTLLLVMLQGVVAVLVSWRGLVAAMPQLASSRQLVDGTLTRTFEKAFNETLVSREPLIAFAAAFRALLLRHDIHDQVVIGRGGWLFYDHELIVDGTIAARTVGTAELVSREVRSLERIGCRVIVMIVPDKAVIHEQRLPFGRLPAELEGNYELLHRALIERGVEAPNLKAHFETRSTQRPLYYRTDTHWNQEGARAAASLVARVATRNAPHELPQRSFATLRAPVARKKPGNLLRMLGLEHVPDLFRPDADEEQSERTVPVSSTDGAPAVVLLGSSFSASANFEGYLRQALATDVRSFVAEGGGVFGSIERFRAEGVTPPRLIIWEFPQSSAR